MMPFNPLKLKKRIIIFSSIALLIAIYLFIHNGFAHNLVLKFKYGKDMATYESLLDNSVHSESYELKHLIQDNLEYFNIDGILFDSINRNFFIGEEIYLSIDNKRYVVWKINEKGAIIDSLCYDNDNFMDSDCGIIWNFKDNYFLDWPITGDTSRKYFAKIIKIDTLMSGDKWIEQLNMLYKRAEIVIFKNYYPEIKYYFKIKDEWTLIYGDMKIYQLDQYKLMEQFPNKTTEQFVSLVREYLYDFRREGKPNSLNNSIKVCMNYSYFLTVKRKYESLRINFNPAYTGTITGFHGIGYFDIKFNNEILKFKTYAFTADHNTINPNITFYYLPENYGIDLLFFSLDRRFQSYSLEDRRLYRRERISCRDERGLYVIRKKI